MRLFGTQKTAEQIEAVYDYNFNMIGDLRVAELGLHVLGLIPNKHDKYEGFFPVALDRPLDTRNREMLDAVYEVYGSALISEEVIQGGHVTAVSRLVGTHERASDTVRPIQVTELQTNDHSSFKVLAHTIE